VGPRGRLGQGTASEHNNMPSLTEVGPPSIPILWVSGSSEGGPYLLLDTLQPRNLEALRPKKVKIPSLILLMEP